MGGGYTVPSRMSTNQTPVSPNAFTQKTSNQKTDIFKRGNWRRRKEIRLQVSGMLCYIQIRALYFIADRVWKKFDL